MTDKNNTASDGIFKTAYYYLFGRKSKKNVFQTDLQKFQNGKQEVSDFYFISLLVIASTLAFGLALQNGMFGYAQGNTWFQIGVTSALFFIGDFALIALAYYLFPKFLTKLFGTFSIVGFAGLSIFAAMAVLVTQQHSKDSYLVTTTQTQITDAIKARDALPANYYSKTEKYNKTINKLKSEIKEMTHDDGGYVSSGSAVYALIAKATRFTVEEVTLFIRLSWSTVFVIGSLTLGGMLATMYCPLLLKQRSKHIANRDTNKAQGEVDYNVKLKSVPTPSCTQGTPKASKGADYTESKYRAVLNGIVAGTVKPSVRSLKSVHGLGTDQAANMLLRMSKSNHLIKKTNGYSLPEMLKNQAE